MDVWVHRKPVRLWGLTRFGPHPRNAVLADLEGMLQLKRAPISAIETTVTWKPLLTFGFIESGI